MAAQVDVSPDVDGLVLGMEWMHENTCMWNVRTGRVSAIDDIVFHAEYDCDTSLVKRVTPLPDEAHAASFVAALDLNLPMDWGGRPSSLVCDIEDDEQPVDIEELLPIRISHIIEPESEQPGAVGVVTTQLGVEGAQADPESSMSDVTDSPPESNYEDEAESESSERDRGEVGPLDPPRESTSVPVPVAQFEQMDDSDDPAPESADPIPEPMIVVPYDPDIVVKKDVEEVELEPELASPDERGQLPPLHELSQGNAMAAFATQQTRIVTTRSLEQNWSRHSRLKRPSE